MKIFDAKIAGSLKRTKKGMIQKTFYKSGKVERNFISNAKIVQGLMTPVEQHIEDLIAAIFRKREEEAIKAMKESE